MKFSDRGQEDCFGTMWADSAVTKHSLARTQVVLSALWVLNLKKKACWFIIQEEMKEDFMVNKEDIF